MKKLVFIGFLGLSLTGCGGGSDSTYVPIDKDNNGNGGSHNAEIKVFILVRRVRAKVLLELLKRTINFGFYIHHHTRT
ncbi:hypothetical protein [Acinetobacter sp. TUM15113]|uniref:hypothetical protein n=1 Tax=Acinetobacter sp. TUM15113 TaxID=2609140 RepID=UPI001D196D93|nr:hypothetical protein [Acinetobacter sp. TUM15113]